MRQRQADLITPGDMRALCSMSISEIQPGTIMLLISRQHGDGQAIFLVNRRFIKLNSWAVHPLTALISSVSKD